jgi:RNA polymerase sigma factor (sigma-70 family)
VGVFVSEFINQFMTTVKSDVLHLDVTFNKDPSLIRRLIQNDQEAWGALMDGSFWQLRGFVKRLVEARTLTKADDDLVRNIVVDTWIAARKAIASYTPNSGCKFSTWLFQIAKNLVAQHFRNTSQRLIVISLEELTLDKREDLQGTNHLDLPEYYPEEEAKREAQVQELNKKIIHALNTLTLLQRQVIIFKELHGYTFSEIARALRIKVNTAKSHHRRGLANLRKIL